MGFSNIQHSFCCKISNKLKGRHFGDIKKISKKSHKAKKGGESHSAEKSKNLLLQNTYKKIAHTHGFEHETSGLKSKHLTTIPRTCELCDLPLETSCGPEKKRPNFPKTLAYRKCKQLETTRRCKHYFLQTNPNCDQIVPKNVNSEIQQINHAKNLYSFHRSHIWYVFMTRDTTCRILSSILLGIFEEVLQVSDLLVLLQFGLLCPLHGVIQLCLQVVQVSLQLLNCRIGLAQSVRDAKSLGFSQVQGLRDNRPLEKRPFL